MFFLIYQTTTDKQAAEPGQGPGRLGPHRAGAAPAKERLPPPERVPYDPAELATRLTHRKPPPGSGFAAKTLHRLLRSQQSLFLRVLFT